MTTKTYICNISCGQLEVEISKEEEFKINCRVIKFGDCSAYTFIGNQITRELNSEETPLEVAGMLKSYTCSKGELGCIPAIGECLEDFLRKTENKI